MSGSHSYAGGLVSAARDLQTAWQLTERQWLDASRREFEREHIEPLLQCLSDAAKSMASCAALLDRLQRECE